MGTDVGGDGAREGESDGVGNQRSIWYETGCAHTFYLVLREPGFRRLRESGEDGDRSWFSEIGRPVGPSEVRQSSRGPVAQLVRAHA